MNHRITSILIGLVIIAAVVGSGIYVKWANIETSTDLAPTTSDSPLDLLREATTSVLEALPTPIPGPPSAEALSNSAALWIGLKNSDDQGTNFDLRVELYRNTTLVAAGESRCITGVTRNPDKAKEVGVPLSVIAHVPPAPRDLLSFKVFTRIGTNANGTKCPGHSNAVGLRLYYDVTNRPSKLNSDVTPIPLTDYFLHSSDRDFANPTSPVTPPSSSFKGRIKDSSALNFKSGNPWLPVGIWQVWQAFSNPEGGYSFSYPADWNLSVKPTGGENLYRPESQDNLSAPSHYTPPSMATRVLHKSPDISITSFVSSWRNGWYAGYAEVTPISVGGKEAVLCNDLPSISFREPPLAAFVDMGNSVLLLMGTTDKETFLDILRTTGVE